MSYAAYLLVMGMATAAAWAAWLVVLVSIDPGRAGGLGLLFFYATLGMALVGTLSISGALLRGWLRKDELMARHVAKSFRQGFLLSGVILGSLLMLGNGFFRWWTILLTILAVGLIEAAFLARHKPIQS